MWEGIKQFFGRIFEAIGSFFKNLFGREETAPAPAPVAAPVAHTSPDAAIAELEARTPLVDEKARGEIGKLVDWANSPGYLGHEFAPEKLRERLAYSNVSPVDPSIGTAINPILQQAKDGRLIVNVPENADVSISRQNPRTVLPGDTPMAVVTVMPSLGEFGKFVRRAYDLDHPGEEEMRESGNFKGRAYLVPVELINKAQVEFKLPQDGKNRITMAQELEGRDTMFVVRSGGAKLETRGIDAFVNGRVQKAKPRENLPDIDEQALMMVEFNNAHARDVADRAAREAAQNRRGSGDEIVENMPQSTPSMNEQSVQWQPLDASFGHWQANRHGRHESQMISKAEEADGDLKKPTSGIPGQPGDPNKGYTA